MIGPLVLILFLSTISCMVEVPPEVNHNVSEVRHVISIEVPLSYQNECQRRYEDVYDDATREELVDECINQFFDSLMNFIKQFEEENTNVL